MSGSVLISGAGIAGCCLAWWLEKYGYDVTLVEQAAAPREGGYVLDFWGLGFEVAERMGLLGELRRHDLDIKQFITVDGRGRTVSGINQGALGELTGGRIMSLPRSAVAAALYEAVKDRVTVRFGDSITAIAEKPTGVDVQFREGSPRPSISLSAPMASTRLCGSWSLARKRRSNGSSDFTWLRSVPRATRIAIGTSMLPMANPAGRSGGSHSMTTRPYFSSSSPTPIPKPFRCTIRRNRRPF